MKTITNEEWQTIQAQSPTNDDLLYLIECTTMKEAAWQQLLKQTPTNQDLRYLIRYTTMRDEAGRELDLRATTRMIDIIKRRIEK